MARPMKFDRDEAVSTAMNEMWRDGFNAASVKALSEKLSISRSSFYNTFGSREDLFREVMRLYVSHTPDRGLYAMTPEVSLKATLTSMFREICRVRASDPEHRGCLAVNCIAELAQADDELALFVQEMLNSNLSMIEEKVAWARESGELPADTDIGATALAIQNLMMGLNLQSKIVHDEAALWASASTTLQALGLRDEESG